jgi:hypothetical protein
MRPNGDLDLARRRAMTRRVDAGMAVEIASFNPHLTTVPN